MSEVNNKKIEENAVTNKKADEPAVNNKKVEKSNAEQNLKTEDKPAALYDPPVSLGQLSVPMKEDVTKIWKDGMENVQEYPMPGFGEWRDPVDYITRHTYDIWDDKGMGKIYKHYKHNALVHTSDGVTYGRDQVIENSVMKMAGYPDIKDYIDDVIWAPDGDGGFHTSMRWTWIARNTGHTIYGPPTGKKVVVWGLANCYVKGNRVVEEWVVYNEISLIKQLGYDPKEVIEATANKGASAQSDPETCGAVERLNGQFPPDEFGENDGRYSDIEYFVRKSYHEIFNRRMFNLFKENYANNYRYHGPSDREITGIGDFVQDQLNLFQSFPDLCLNVEDFYYMYDKARDEYRCATRWTIIGNHNGFGIYGSGTGRHVVINGISQHIVKDGKFQEEWSIYDELALQRGILRQRRRNEQKEDEMNK